MVYYKCVSCTARSDITTSFSSNYTCTLRFLCLEWFNVLDCNHQVLNIVNGGIVLRERNFEFLSFFSKNVFTLVLYGKFYFIKMSQDGSMVMLWSEEERAVRMVIKNCCLVIRIFIGKWRSWVSFYVEKTSSWISTQWAELSWKWGVFSRFFWPLSYKTFAKNEPFTFVPHIQNLWTKLIEIYF